MQPTKLLENQSLQTIIEYIINGVNEIDELLITNSVSNKYSEIAIKPCTIDISSNVLEFYSITKTESLMAETELIDFVCYRKTVDADTQQEVLNNISLLEFIFIDKDLIHSGGWDLLDFSGN